MSTTGKRTRERRMLTAYHEAGHAVVAFDQGVRVHGISIVPDGMRTGHVRIDTLHLDRRAPTFATDKGARNRFTMERHVMVLLGGYAAVKKLHPESDVRRIWKQGEGSDQSSALVLLRAFAAGEEEAAKYLQWLEARTAGIVASPMRWHQVERLAEALLERETLGSRTVREIIREAGRQWAENHGG